MNEPADKFRLNRFIIYLDIEEGLSSNTIEAYMHDTGRYITFLISKGLTAPDEVTKEMVDVFAESLRKQNLSRNSISRNFAAVKSYHNFLLREKITVNNPTETFKFSIPRRVLPE